ncbi:MULTISPECIES: YgdI/YgdR family lipoprotein [Pseudomonas]|uniref:YgdI/YgdR family lipoprotein n=1 Tax=Pseudomonas TaxID=286 RepID=UPI0003F87A65|nr:MULTISPECIES: YgdI/YgdR family lipoprotein [Pseudomonas]MBK4988061.1 YgdI/YgdR family lipoprotein [Pseudomonas sp. S36]MBK5003624.1 YgdI/YgdR family lipoprotein [Pseudomonas sp. S32]MBK5010253.1 YgdI/YgdR family lipoprotein [Pseudomonas sp. S60]
MNSLKRIFVTVGLCLLAGCATPSSMILKDGRELQTLDTPKYDKQSGFFEFKLLDGKPQKINRDSVLTIRNLK